MADRDVPAAAELTELRRREQEAGITPDAALDRFMEAMSLQARCRRLRLRSSSSPVLTERLCHGWKQQLHK